MLGHIDDAVHVEADLLRVGAPVLVVEAVRVLSVLSCYEAVVARRHASLVLLVRPRWCLDPEVDLEVPAAAKLAVAHLECDRHLVVLVQLLVEALPHVRLHLDVVRRHEPDEGARRCEDREDGEPHRGPWIGAAQEN